MKNFSPKKYFWIVVFLFFANIFFVILGRITNNTELVILNSFFAGACATAIFSCYEQYGKKLFCFRHQWGVREVHELNVYGDLRTASRIMKCEKCGERINL